MSGADAETVRAALLELRPYDLKREHVGALAALDRLAESAGRVAEAEKALRKITRKHYEWHIIDGQRVVTNSHTEGCPGCIADKALAALSHSPEAVQAGDARMENAPTEEGN